MGLPCICQDVLDEQSTLEEGGPPSTPLFNDIKRMQSDDAFSDMVFVCGEEEEDIRACRMLVASRSPALQSMLLREPRPTRIPLPHIHPTAMRICLEYFHTDNVQQSSWPNISMAMHVLNAAMFFLIKPLEILALKYFINTLRLLPSNKDAAWCASLITCYNLGVKVYSSHSSNQDNDNYACLLYKFLNDFRKQAMRHVAGCSNVNLFSGSGFERRFYKDLSEPALFHFIEGVQSYHLRPYALSPYFAFLHVVRWNAYRVVVKKPSIDEGEFEKVLDKCFPRSAQVMRKMLSSAVDINDNISKYMKLLAAPLSKCLERAPIDFAEMPPHILCRFIEPMNVVSPSTLLSAYRSQALCSPELRWDELAHGKQYEIDEVIPTVITCSSSELKGFARCSPYLNSLADSFFDWEVVICIPCDELRIGFCLCKPTFRVSECSSKVLGDRELSWALGADGFLHTGGQKSSAPYVNAFVKEKVVIQVRLDMVNGDCSFSFDGKDAGVAWSHLPLGDDHALYLYPAVSLQSPARVEVRMVYHSWMDHASKRMCPSTSYGTYEETSYSEAASNSSSESSCGNTY